MASLNVPALPDDLQSLRVLSIEEARAVLRCGRHTVKRLIAEGAFGPPEHLKIGGFYRLPRVAVERYADGERGGAV